MIREAFLEALVVAERVPNVMKERIQRELESAGASGV